MGPDLVNDFRWSQKCEEGQGTKREAVSLDNTNMQRVTIQYRRYVSKFEHSGSTR